MKWVFSVLHCVIVWTLITSSVSAVVYKKDYLEPGNPGGWTGSLKTFDEEIPLVENETIYVDIWLSNMSEQTELFSGGVWIDFQDYTGFIEIVSIKRYNNCTVGKENCLYGEELPGPWDAGGFVVIGPGAEVPEGKILVQTLNIEEAQKDGDGEIIIARVELYCVETGVANLTEETIPGFVTQSINSDSDDIFDEEDNCDNVPNGPGSGTCTKESSGVVMGRGIVCTSDDGCASGEICQMRQEDFNGNGCGDACECYADCDCDTKVNLSDLVLMKEEFLQSPVFADCNSDGKVDLSDLVIMKMQFLRTDCPVCP